jgi:hypothetical protein
MMLLLFLRQTNTRLMFLSGESDSEVITELREAVSRKDVARLINIVLLKGCLAHVLKFLAFHSFEGPLM